MNSELLGSLVGVIPGASGITTCFSQNHQEDTVGEEELLQIRGPEGAGKCLTVYIRNYRNLEKSLPHSSPSIALPDL